MPQSKGRQELAYLNDTFSNHNIMLFMLCPYRSSSSNRLSSRNINNVSYDKYATIQPQIHTERLLRMQQGVSQFGKLVFILYAIYTIK